jgi:hypothetical protein
MDVPTILDVFVSYGFETDDEMTDDRKLEALNETYHEVCGRDQWPFLEQRQAVSIDPVTGLVTAANSKIVRTVQSFTRTDNGSRLEPYRLDDLLQQMQPLSNQAGDPVYYYFLGDDLYVAPIPATDPGTWLLQFTERPRDLLATSLETDIAIPSRYHRSTLVLGTLSKLALMQDDPEMGQAYERLFEKALSLMVDDLFRRQTDRPEFIHVNDPDNWDYSA